MRFEVMDHGGVGGSVGFEQMHRNGAAGELFEEVGRNGVGREGTCEERLPEANLAHRVSRCGWSVPGEAHSGEGPHMMTLGVPGAI